MKPEKTNRATHSRLLRIALPWVLSAVFCWLIYGVARRMLGSSGGSLNRRYRDFLEFYSGAAAMLRGGDVYAAGYLGYIYPPLFAFLMLPLAKLSIAKAALVWIAVKTGLLAACGWLGAKEVRSRFSLSTDWLSVALVFLISALLDIDKLRTEMNMQQSNLLILLCFILALRWLDRRPLLSGLALGFGANIKYVTLVSLPYLLVRRRFKAFFATIAGSLSWALLPATILGWHRNMELLGKAVDGLVNLARTDAAAAGSAKIFGPLFGLSVPAFAARYFGSGGGHSAVSITVVFAAALLFSLAVRAIYRAAGVPLFPGRAGQPEKRGLAAGVVALEWAGLIVIVLAFSPQTDSPHLSMLLVPCLAAVCVLSMPYGQVSGTPLVLGLAVMVAGLVLPPGAVGLDRAVHFWLDLSGPIWCVLIMYLTLLWVGLRRLKAQAVSRSNVDLDFWRE
ncbi:MAG: glycosyltransferase family 87 protein [Nitrospiraceae bacterium]|nr:glycosyltransferase family 87 protein [Nitrospiraceae bacterium]